VIAVLEQVENGLARRPRRHVAEDLLGVGFPYASLGHLVQDLAVDDDGRGGFGGGRWQVTDRMASPALRRFETALAFLPSLLIGLELRPVPKRQLVKSAVVHGINGPFGQVTEGGELVEGRAELFFDLRPVTIGANAEELADILVVFFKAAIAL
jgi:hypothetical protein